MHTRIRIGIRIGAVAAALVAVSSLVPTMAQAADSGWTTVADAAFVKASVASPGAVAGHRGNWHTLFLDVDLDDDGVTGGLIDWRCPAGSDPISDTDACTRLASFSLYDAAEVTVTYDRTLKYLRVRGPVVLEVDGTASTRRSNIDVRFLGTGAYSQTVSTSTEGTTLTRVVDSRRTGVEAHGRFGWVPADGEGVVEQASDLTGYVIRTRELS